MNKQQFLLTRLRQKKGKKKSKKRDFEPDSYRNSSCINLFGMVRVADLEENTVVFFLAMRLVGSQFPDQGLNPGHGSENPES